MSGGLRIVHCFRAPVGGVFRHVRDLCEAQAAAGHQVGIVCDSSTGGAFEDRLFTEIEDLLSLGIVRTPMQRHVGPKDLTAALHILKIIRRMRPDVLHGHGAKGGALARSFGTAMRLGGRKVARIYAPHGGSLHYDAETLAGRFFFLLEALMGRITDRILFVSEYEQRIYEQKIGRPYAPTSLVYNGLRVEEFRKLADAPEAADFVFVGTMRDLKGPDLFIDALAKVEAKLQRRVCAVMVGDGEKRDKYAAQARERGLADRVVFHPAMPARQAFALGRIMVVPSRAEAMPYIVLEALAADRPVIATAVGGIPEILGKDSPALCAPSVAPIAERMATALEDEAAFRRFMPARSLVKSRFSAAAMAASIESIYRETLGG